MDTFNRARLLILNRLLSFPTVSGSDWRSCSFGQPPNEGDLISLQSAMPSKWQISWYVRKERPKGWCEDRHLLRSIEDGELCWWTNVEFSVYERRDLITEDWKWTDAQFKFVDKFHNVLAKEHPFIIKARRPSFNKNGGVCFKFYCRWDFGDKWSFSKEFPNWKKVTKAQIRDAYLAAVDNYEKAGV